MQTTCVSSATSNNNILKTDQSKDLISLDGEVFSGERATEVNNFEDTALEQYRQFQISIEKDGVNAKIKQNRLILFEDTKHIRRNAATISAKVYRNDASLMGSLFIAAQSRKCKLAEVFEHESKLSPPSLSDEGKLYHSQKAELLHEIIRPVESPENFEDEECEEEFPSTYDCIIQDGGQLLHELCPKGNVSTFDDYAHDNFLPMIRRTLRATTRFDIVNDNYLKESLKEERRESRGSGKIDSERKFKASRKVEPVSPRL